MNFLIVVLLVCFIAFLYVIYFLSHDDFVILRKDVPLERIFNYAFIFGLSSLFFGRLSYVLQNPNNVFMNPLGFILFPYFPGLSFIGAMTGGFVFTMLMLRSGKLPVGRILDFFSIGLLSVIPFGFLGIFFLSGGKLTFVIFVSFIFFVALLLVFLKYIMPRSLGGKFQDGSLSLSFLASFSFLYFIFNILVTGQFFGKENILTVLLFAFSLTLFIQQEAMGRIVFKK